MPTVADLGAMVKAKHPEYANLPDAEVGARVKAKYPQYANFTNLPASGAEVPQLGQTPGLPQRLFNRGVAALPTLGAAGMGLALTELGPAAMFAGYGIGGSLGKGLQQAYSGQNIDPAAIAHEGGKQALLGFGGDVAGAAVGAAAKPMLKSGLGQSALNTLNRFYSRGGTVPAAEAQAATQNALDMMLREKIASQPTAEALRQQSAARTMDLLRGAKNAGFQTAASDVIAPALPLTTAPALDLAENKAAGRTINRFTEKYAARELPDQVSQILDQYGNPAVVRPGEVIPEQPIDPVTLKEIKRLKGAQAKWTKLNQGLTPNQMATKGIAVGAQKALEGIDGIAASEARTQNLIGINKALKSSAASSPGFFQSALGYGGGGAIGYGAGHGPLGGLAGAMIGKALTSRQAMIKYSMLMADPTFQALLRKSPQAAYELYNQSLQSTAPSDATSGN